MRNTTKRRHRLAMVGLCLIGCLASATGRAGSYAVDGRCYCSGPIAPGLADRIVPTPVGGQSVASVCERIGSGPGPTLSDGQPGPVRYDDPQCGHGPIDGGGNGSPDGACDAATTSGSCARVGPRWDLEDAYSRPAAKAVDEVIRQLGPAGTIGAAAAPPVLAAARQESGDPASALPSEPLVVVIDGRRWKAAPPGTPEKGEPGTRIVLDDRLFLAIGKDGTDPSVPQPARTPVRESVPVPAREPVRMPARKPERAPMREPVPARTRGAARTPTSESARIETIVEASLETLERQRRALMLEARAHVRARRQERSGTPPSLAAASAPSGAEPFPDEGSATVDKPTTRGSSPPLRDASGSVPTADDTDDTEGGEVGEGDRTVATERRDGDGDGDGAGAGGRGIEPASALSRRFNYVDAIPLDYDRGGNGLLLEGSVPLPDRFRLFGRLGSAAGYRELTLGVSWHVTAPRLGGLSFVLSAGTQSARFEPSGDETGAGQTDHGVYMGGASLLTFGERFALQAGVGYSSVFDGGAIAFGGTLYRLAARLDVVSRLELGDNDSVGLGVRYYY